MLTYMTKEEFLSSLSDDAPMLKYYTNAFVAIENRAERKIEKILPMCSESDGEFEVVHVIREGLASNGREKVELGIADYDGFSTVDLWLEAQGGSWFDGYIIETNEPAMTSLDFILFE